MHKLILIILVVCVAVILVQVAASYSTHLRQWLTWIAPAWLAAAEIASEAEVAVEIGEDIIGADEHEHTPAGDKRGAASAGQISGGLMQRVRQRRGSQRVSFTVKDLKAHPRTKSEASVVELLESITGCKFPTVIMNQGRQRFELDGYCARMHLAIEYQGPLHTKWYPAQEPYETYLARVLKDEEKKRACERAGIHLIVIDMTQHGPGLRLYLESRLSDLGLRPRPNDYAPEKIVTPFRNPQLERELSRAKQ